MMVIFLPSLHVRYFIEQLHALLHRILDKSPTNQVAVWITRVDWTICGLVKSPTANL